MLVTAQIVGNKIMIFLLIIFVTKNNTFLTCDRKKLCMAKAFFRKQRQKVPQMLHLPVTRNLPKPLNSAILV